LNGETPAAEAASRPWVVYLLECAGERLYAGITNDLAARFDAHRAGRGARFTKAFAPLRVVAASELPSRSDAGKLAFLAACGLPLDPSLLPRA